MRIFAIFDEHGFPKRFYTTVIHSEIPEVAIPISVEQWHQFIKNSGQCRWDGEKVVEYVPGQHSRQPSARPQRKRWRPLRSLFSIFRQKA
jgi:hypothetical protein